MCIIIAKEKLGRLPSEEELKNSFEFNNDGGGFMYVKNGKVVVDKGYMTWDAFIKHFKTLCVEFNDFKNKSLVIHCRIGTSGKNIKGNTHPFPITDNVRLLKSKHISNLDIGIVHNGIIRGYGTATGLNDTQEFISKYIYPLYSNWKDFYKNEDIMYGIKEITNSKFVILDSTDTLYYIGEFIEDKGLYFSNTSYKTLYYKNYLYQDYDRYYDNDWYEEMYRKEKEEEVKDIQDDYLIPLDKGWYVDFYANGDVKKVETDNYWYDYDTLELYEYDNGEMKLLAVNPLIYDESYEEIF